MIVDLLQNLVVGDCHKNSYQTYPPQLPYCLFKEVSFYLALFFCPRHVFLFLFLNICRNYFCLRLSSENHLLFFPRWLIKCGLKRKQGIKACLVHIYF